MDSSTVAAASEALRNLPMPSEGAREYIAKHIPRLSRTIALVPKPFKTKRTLELGCYMQITPLLARIAGYEEVRGGYFGRPGRIDHKVIQFPDGEFQCYVDHFDAERDRYPYPDGQFDLVVATEIFEHLIYNPMHLLLESRRVLTEGGYILLSTPNSAGLACVLKALQGKRTPQVYAHFKIPDDEPEVGHRREYTLAELGQSVQAAGFRIEKLFTTVIDEYEGKWRDTVLEILGANGFPTEQRGEQSWCLARKDSTLPIEPYPSSIFGP
jgi:SAM-dependent methyltransferase